MTFFTHSAKQAVTIHAVTAAQLPELLKQLPAAMREWAKQQRFTAAVGTALLVPDSGGKLARVLAGVDARPGIWSIAHVAALVPPGTYRLDAEWSAAEIAEAALGFALAQYQFTKYKKLEPKGLTLALPKSVNLTRLEALRASIWLVRDLINTPANDMGPASLAAAAKKMAKASGAKFSEIVGDALLAANYPAIHAVGRAGPEAPRLITIEHGRKNDPLVVLVGKGVTFDTGGLDIKPYASMKLMKKDMGGAALVLGLAQLIIATGAKVRLKVLIPAVENSIASNAFRPQDVINSRKGLTIEIGSTDAEGRLILADALADGDEEEPALMIDVATLTGAARTALGPELPALYANREEIGRQIAHIGAMIGDPVWVMPLWQPYAKYVNSSIADVTNTPNFGFAGSITAALFLERFVSPETPWVHIDSYAWNAESAPGRPAGGEALCLRALFQYIEAHVASGAPAR